MRSKGVVLAVLGAVLLFVPILRVGQAHFSVSQAHGMCSSGLGEFATALSGTVASDCNHVSLFFYLCWAGVIVGGVMFLVGTSGRKI
jgi:hypothetical protein